jgi:hypothetical protein
VTHPLPSLILLLNWRQEYSYHLRNRPIDYPWVKEADWFRGRGVGGGGEGGILFHASSEYTFTCTCIVHVQYINMFYVYSILYMYIYVYVCIYCTVCTVCLLIQYMCIKNVQVHVYIHKHVYMYI